jgi:hypothetical protein
MLRAEPRQPVEHELAAGPAHDITDEKQFQHGSKMPPGPVRANG